MITVFIEKSRSPYVDVLLDVPWTKENSVKGISNIFASLVSL